MTISIITINYNNLSGLKKTAKSVRELEYNDFEWIIIDGGSCDGSTEFIEDISNKCPQISFWCSEKDKGVYNAMNKGIKQSKGEYLIFMNSGDCFFSSQTIANVFRTPHSADIIYGDALYVFNDHEELRKVPTRLTFRYIYEYTIYHQSAFIKRELLITSNGYDESLKIVSDWKMWLIWILQNKKYEYTKETICRFDAYGISTGHDDAILKERNIVFQKVLPPGMKAIMDEIYSYESITPYQPQLFSIIRRKKIYKKLISAIIHLIKYFQPTKNK